MLNAYHSKLNENTIFCLNQRPFIKKELDFSWNKSLVHQIKSYSTSCSSKIVVQTNSTKDNYHVYSLLLPSLCDSIWKHNLLDKTGEKKIF